MQLPEQQYDKATCVTVGELRSAGYVVPDHVPDHAWVHKSAIALQLGEAERIEGNRAAIRVRLAISQPFRWDAPIEDQTQ